MQTSISVYEDASYFSSDDRKWITKIRKLKAQHPEDVQILAEPENNDGCIYVKLPVNWMKITPPRKVELTDEQRAARAERLKNAQQLSRNRTKKKDDDNGTGSEAY